MSLGEHVLGAMTPDRQFEWSNTVTLKDNSQIIVRTDLAPRVEVAGPAQAAKLVNRIAPIYPPLARQTRIQGVVKLHAIIDTDGAVLELSVIEGHPLLLQAALDAVKQWRYQPTLVEGRPVKVDTEIDVTFRLSQ